MSVSTTLHETETYHLKLPHGPQHFLPTSAAQPPYAGVQIQCIHPKRVGCPVVIMQDTIQEGAYRQPTMSVPLKAMIFDDKDDFNAACTLPHDTAMHTSDQHASYRLLGFSLLPAAASSHLHF